MPAITRAVQKIFGSALTPAGNIAQIGSLAAGAPAYSGDIASIQSLVQYLSGFNGIDVGNRSPAFQDMNALFYMVTTQLAYLLQRGAPPEWNADTTYFQYCTVQKGGGTFTCLANNVVTDPAADSVNWASGLLKMQAGITTGGAQLIPVDGAGHLINFNSAISNPYLCFNVGTYKYTALVRGDYLVGASVQADNSGASAGTMEMALRAVKNGATIVGGGGESVPNPPGSRWYPKIPGVMVTLALGDTLEFQLEATDGVGVGNVQVSNSSCSITRI